MNNLPQAEAAFVRELELDGHNALAMYKLGYIRVKRGNTKEGLPLLEKAVAQAPGMLDARYYLARAYSELGDQDRALTELERVRSDGPTGILAESVWYQLGQVYRKKGRPDESRAALEKYRELKAAHDAEWTSKLDETKRRILQ